jgi:hypothetical protein
VGSSEGGSQLVHCLRTTADDLQHVSVCHHEPMNLCTCTRDSKHSYSIIRALRRNSVCQPVGAPAPHPVRSRTYRCRTGFSELLCSFHHNQDATTAAKYFVRTSIPCTSRISECTSFSERKTLRCCPKRFGDSNRARSAVYSVRHHAGVGQCVDWKRVAASERVPLLPRTKRIQVLTLRAFLRQVLFSAGAHGHDTACCFLPSRRTVSMFIVPQSELLEE